MADLPQIPGTSGPPQIPGGASYSAGTAGPKVPGASFSPMPDGGPPSGKRKRPGRRRRGKLRAVHFAVAGIIALIGIARSSPEVKTPTITLPKIEVPKLGDIDATGGSRTAAKVPAATVYRAAPGTVDGQPRTTVELGVRNNRIRWVAASRFPTSCTDGSSSSGLLFYTDEGKASRRSGVLRYEDSNLRLTFRPGSGHGTLRYRRSYPDTNGGNDSTCTGSVSFPTRRATSSVLAQGLLNADRRAAEAIGGD